MGLDFTTLEVILQSLLYNPNKKNLLTLGRQQINMHKYNINFLFNKYNLSYFNNKYTYDDYCEDLLYDLGFLDIDSLDANNYQNATIIHNLNLPIPYNLKHYDYIFDGGTIEHIFNIPQVLENIINLLEIEGIFCSITCNNNFSGHGMYQFSPELFLSSLTEKYGMQILALYIAENNTEFHTWIDVNDFNKQNNGRNIASFKSNKEVYIITIAKKISNTRESLITNPPNQYSYENITWN